MRQLVRTLVLVLVVMFVFTAAIFPPDKNLKLGKDLSGGVSLIYSIAIAPGEDAASTISRTIDVLKRRVDPDGLFEISMVASGRDRIEITMPLPNERVKQLRAEYEAALEDIGRLALTPREFERLMAMPAADRGPEIARIAAGSETLAKDLTTAAAAYDNGHDAAKAVAAAIAGNASDEEINNLAALKADADQQYASARSRVLESALTADMVRQALSLSNRKSYLLDEQTGQSVEIPSQRERAIEDLKQRFPDALPRLEEAIRRFEAYSKERRTLDDPQDLIRLLRGAGILTFRITVDPGQHPDEARLRQEVRAGGPGSSSATDARWYKINDIRTWYNSVQSYQALTANPQAFFQARGYVVEPWAGEYYMLCWDARGSRLTPLEGQWAVADAFPQSDSKGRPGIGFKMDPQGSTLLGQLTGAHVNDSMAVLLDDQVYTAPDLNSQISSQGIIEGNFEPDEIQYVTQVLAAGSLQAKLSREPISQITVGPELGLDNLRQGIRAGWIALIVISAFMVIYYFAYGLVSFICLACTGLLILGAMALQAAAFSLPGIAGIVLTFGMAVDANVLIFERVREELKAGKDLRTALRLGFSKALSAIVDGNVTNLIVCVVLVLPGVATPEIKGFAITLGVGVVATLFAALVIGRLVFDLLLLAGVRKMSMLALSFPAIDRFFTPKINWLGMRWIFAGISICYVGLGMGMVVFRGGKMLDTEFLGGTRVTVQFRQGPDGSVPTRADVDERIRGTDGILAHLEADARAKAAAAAAPGATPEQIADAQRAQRLYTAVEPLRTADVLPVNPRSDGVSSDRFSIKSLATDANAIQEVIVAGFQDFAYKIDGRPAYHFAGSTIPASEIRTAPVFPILNARLGSNLPNAPTAAADEDVTPYVGGVAIVLADLEPTPSLEDIEVSLEDMRIKPDFSSTLARERKVLLLDGTPDAVRRAVILAHDENYSFFDSEERWRANVAASEWNLTVQGLTKPTTLAQAETFSAAVAETIKAQAIAAVTLSFLLILIYCWVRFGSVRYSLGAIACSVHDCLTVLGMIALCEVVYDSQALSSVAQSMGILPFKIDLNLIAAILTIIGYSLNDTIIVLDRIRETKGKLPYETADIVNDAINNTISRTIITSGTTMLSAIILYVFGGEGVRAFAFALIVGIAVGTYSSIAVAAPIVWSRKKGVSPAEAASPAPALPS